MEAEGKTAGEAAGSVCLGSESVMAWCSSESGNKTTVYFFLNALLVEMAVQHLTKLRSLNQTSW